MKNMKNMSQHDELETATGAFLDAERRIDASRPDAGPVGESEQALFALFANLPEVAPRPDFAAAVLRRAGIERRDFGWQGQVATAMAYLLVLAGAVWLLPVVVGLLGQFELSAALKAMVDLFTFVVARIGDLVAFSQKLAGFGRVLWLILTSPPVVLVTTLCAALTLLMGRWLATLLAVPRSSLHAAVR